MRVAGLVLPLGKGRGGIHLVTNGSTAACREAANCDNVAAGGVRCRGHHERPV